MGAGHTSMLHQWQLKALASHKKPLLTRCGGLPNFPPKRSQQDFHPADFKL
jgi:hypothetical protein